MNPGQSKSNEARSSRCEMWGQLHGLRHITFICPLIYGKEEGIPVPQAMFCYLQMCVFLLC